MSDLTLHTTKESGQEKVLAIDELVVRLTLFRLLFDEIVVSKFELNGAFLNVVKSPTQLVIAGIDLNKQGDAKPVKEETSSTSEPIPYQLILPELALKKFNIDINKDEIPHHVLIKELLVSEVKADQSYQTAVLSLASTIDDTTLELIADAELDQGRGEVNSQISISNYPIQRVQRYVSDLSELSGLLSLSSKQKIVIAPDELKVHVTNANLKSDNLVVGYQQQFFNLEKLENHINDLQLTLTNGEITELSGASQFVLDNADVHYEKFTQTWAYLEQLALTVISFHFINEPQVKIASVIVDDIFASKNFPVLSICGIC